MSEGAHKYIIYRKKVYSDIGLIKLQTTEPYIMHGSTCICRYFYI